MVPISYYLIVSGILFMIGMVGVLTRRNAIIIFMSVELMLNAVNLSFVSFSNMWGDITGQVFVFMVMAVAAAEVGVGLALVIAIFRMKETVDINSMNLMKE